MKNYENYKTDYKGSSTDFLLYSHEELQNLSNIAIEDTNYGKILFPGAINVTRDGNLSDNKVDIDSNTNISYNILTRAYSRVLIRIHQGGNYCGR